MTSSPNDTVEIDTPGVSDARHLASIIEDRNLTPAAFAPSIDVEVSRLEEALAGDAQLAHSKAERIGEPSSYPVSAD